MPFSGNRQGSYEVIAGGNMEPREPCIFLQRCVFRIKNIAATASLFFQRYPSFQAHLDRNVCSSYPACHNRLQSRDAACCKSRCSATGWPLPLLLCGHWSNWKSIYSSSLVQPCFVYRVARWVSRLRHASKTHFEGASTAVLFPEYIT